MNVISTTVEYRGTSIKVQNGKVFARAFGTTINNHSMHWSWQEIKQEAMKRDFKDFLRQNNLI